jgi:alpha-ketoglutarate-dependent taurine dioxygenase
LLDQFERIAERPDHHLTLELARGDLLVVNNNKVLHARTAYEDVPQAPKRSLLRMWVDLPSGTDGVTPSSFERPSTLDVS